MGKQTITDTWQPIAHVDPDLLWFLSRLNMVEIADHPVLWCKVVRMKRPAEAE